MTKLTSLWTIVFWSFSSSSTSTSPSSTSSTSSSWSSWSWLEKMSKLTSQQTLARGDWQYLLPDVSWSLFYRYHHHHHHHPHPHHHHHHHQGWSKICLNFVDDHQQLLDWCSFHLCLTFDYFCRSLALIISKHLDNLDNYYHQYRHCHCYHYHHCSISSTISWAGSTQTLSLPYFLSSFRFN